MRDRLLTLMWAALAGGFFVLWIEAMLADNMSESTVVAMATTFWAILAIYFSGED